MSASNRLQVNIVLLVREGMSESNLQEILEVC